MDSAYADKLAKIIKGVMYSLVRKDWHHRTVDAKGMKTKDSKEIVRAFPNMIKNSTQEILGPERIRTCSRV